MLLFSCIFQKSGMAKRKEIGVRHQISKMASGVMVDTQRLPSL